MILAETIFVSGEPVGVVRQDTNIGEIAFSPTKTPSKVSPRDWKSVDDLKTEVIAVYNQHTTI